MALVRSDPFRDVDRLFQQLWGGQNGNGNRPLAMPMDAFRKDDSFLIRLDLPGVSADAVELTVEENVLTIKAERLAPPASESIEVVIAERPTEPSPDRCSSAPILTPSTSRQSTKQGCSPWPFRWPSTQSPAGSRSPDEVTTSNYQPDPFTKRAPSGDRDAAVLCLPVSVAVRGRPDPI